MTSMSFKACSTQNYLIPSIKLWELLWLEISHGKAHILAYLAIWLKMVQNNLHNPEFLSPCPCSKGYCQISWFPVDFFNPCELVAILLFTCNYAYMVPMFSKSSVLLLLASRTPAGIATDCYIYLATNHVIQQVLRPAAHQSKLIHSLLVEFTEPISGLDVLPTAWIMRTFRAKNGGDTSNTQQSFSFSSTQSVGYMGPDTIALATWALWETGGKIWPNCKFRYARELHWWGHLYRGVVIWRTANHLPSLIRIRIVSFPSN